MKIELSNRGEVDLGTDAASYGSYGHFYTEGTKYEEIFDCNTDDCCYVTAFNRTIDDGESGN
jgi:hypothetical protein